MHTSSTKRSTADYLAWALALVMAAAAVMKLAMFRSTVAQFEQFGYEPWFIYVTVLVELLGAGLTIVPVTRYYGASLIALTMLGAMLSHLKADQPSEMIVPFVLFVVALCVSWSHPAPIKSESQDANADSPDQPHDHKTDPSARRWKNLAMIGAMVVVGYLSLLLLFGEELWLHNRVLLRRFGAMVGIVVFLVLMSAISEPPTDDEAAVSKKSSE